jgi:hypothetical protein
MGVCIINTFDNREPKLERKHSEIKIGHVDIEHKK